MPAAAAAAPRAETRWRSAVQEHQVALAAYLTAAERLPESAWRQPWQAGKWTPALITEHLSLCYVAFISEAREGRTMALKLTPFRRRMLKLLLLPHMLFHHSFPRGARAPREVRPEEPSLSRDQALARLRALGEEFEREVERGRARGLQHVTHPYFGAIDLTRGMRFCALHIDHHRAQITR